MSEPHTIEVAVSGSSNAVRSHDHPMLESGNLSFPKGRYLLDFHRGEDRSSCVIEHRIEGAALVERLLGAGQAQYACIVSSPVSSYRHAHFSNNPRQEVSWNNDDLGDSPLFTPMILCVKPIMVTINSERDSVHRLWNQQRVNLQKGSRLALGSVVQFQSSIFQLLSLREDPHLGDGQIVVEVTTEPFRFQVGLSTGLHKLLRFPNNPIRNHIMTHIVTACFARLQKDYADDDGDQGWRSFRNLKALADFLEHKGQMHWSEPDFRPEKVATALYPHRLSGVDLDRESDA